MARNGQGTVAICAAVLTSLASTFAHAGENLWIYARGSDPRPKGTFGFTLQDIVKSGKAGGAYTSQEIQSTLEYGLTNKLTLAGRAIVFDHEYEIEDARLQPYFTTQGGRDGRFSQVEFGGYDVNLRYNLMSNYAGAPFGLTIGAAAGHLDVNRLDGERVSQDEIRFTASAQKNFLDNTLVFALSPGIAFEKRGFETGPDVEEVSLTVSAGASYRFARGWFASFEYRHQSEFFVPQLIAIRDLRNPGGAVLDPTDSNLLSLNFGDRFQHANYIGPSLHYGTARWWMTAGAMFQVQGGGAPGSFNADGLNYSGHEDVHLSVALGVNL